MDKKISFLIVIQMLALAASPTKATKEHLNGSQDFISAPVKMAKVTKCLEDVQKSSDWKTGDLSAEFMDSLTVIRELNINFCMKSATQMKICNDGWDRFLATCGKYESGANG